MATRHHPLRQDNQVAQGHPVQEVGQFPALILASQTGERSHHIPAGGFIF